MSSNVTNGKIKEYYYNAQNKLVKIELANHDYYEFTYDSQNRRIEISTNGISRYTIHDPSVAGQVHNVPIGETDSNGYVTRWFVRDVGIAEGTGDVIAEIDNSGSAHYYLPNH